MLVVNHHLCERLGEYGQREVPRAHTEHERQNQSCCWEPNRESYLRLYDHLGSGEKKIQRNDG